MSPPLATATFVTHLLEVPGGQNMAPWLAAQAAELPAAPPVAALRANWGRAGQVVAAVLRNGNQPGACGQGTGRLAGPAASDGLPPVTSSHRGHPRARAAVAYALAQLGKPYVWGAAGPAAFDCSGLTMAAWARPGVPLLHYTGDQQHEGVAVTAATLIPGDLVLTPGRTRPPRCRRPCRAVHRRRPRRLGHRPAAGGGGAVLGDVRLRRADRPPRPRPWRQ